MTIAMVVVAGIVGIVLGLLLLRPWLDARMDEDDEAPPEPPPAGPPPVTGGPTT